MINLCVNVMCRYNLKMLSDKDVGLIISRHNRWKNFKTRVRFLVHKDGSKKDKKFSYEKRV